jgi:predicted N-acetyltransferase YhbS
MPEPKRGGRRPSDGDETVDFSTDYATRASEIAALFAATFTDSEDAEEGALIGALARRLMAETPAQDLRVFTAWDSDALIGGIIFSRLVYEGDSRTVFLLAPVSVATDRQGQGVGRRLIAHGLDALRRDGVDIALTYGDPAFYGRVGFRSITEAAAPAPFALQQPEGWLGQSLTDAELTPLSGPARCVPAIDDPVFW